MAEPLLIPMRTLVTCVAIAIVCTACSDVPETTGLPNDGSGGTTGVPGAAGSGAGVASGGSSAGTSSGTAGSLSMAGSGGVSSGTAGSNSGAAGSAGSAPVDGAAIYNAQCKVCHEDQGIGGKLGPELQHPVRDYATWVVRNGLPGAAFPKPMEKIGADALSDAELNMVWDYLDKPPQPTTGQALYLDYCGNCHGADGKGGPTTRNILMELDNLRDKVTNGAHAGDFGNRKEYMPKLKGAKLTDAEIDLIYAYVDSL